MQFKIDQSILDKFSDVKLGLLVAKGIDNTGRNKQAIAKQQETEKEVRTKLEIETLADHPKIKDWRDAYSTFGAKPKTYKNSVEALLRRVLKGDSLPIINNLVTTYNTISIKHMLPAGGDDLDKINGDICLTIAQGSEQFTMLGGKESETVEAGEVIYRDDKEVLCRRWNWRECDKSKMAETTKNVCIVLEGLSNTSEKELKIALEELQQDVQKVCGGKSEMYVLNKENSFVEF